MKLKSSSPQGSSKCQRLYCLGDKTQNTQSKQLLLTTHQAGSLAPTNPPKSPKQHTCLSPSELCTGLHSSIVLLLFAEKTLLEDRFSSIPSRKSPITNKRWAVHTGLACFYACTIGRWHNESKASIEVLDLNFYASKLSQVIYFYLQLSVEHIDQCEQTCFSARS